MPLSLKYPWINPSMLILLQLVLKILMLLLHKKKNNFWIPYQCNSEKYTKGCNEKI